MLHVVLMPTPFGVLLIFAAGFHSQIKICTKKAVKSHQDRVPMVVVVIFVEAQTMSRARYLSECNGSLFKGVVNEKAVLGVVRGAQ